MKKIINAPERVVDEMIDGILKAYPYHFKTVASAARGVRSLVLASSPIKGKVGIATGGGSGHLPLFLGYLGKGLADGVAIGDVFSSPSAQEMLAVTKVISGGAGVLYLYGNYGGDVMNFDMAAEMAEDEGIHVLTSLGADDVASAPPAEKEVRRGIAGIFYTMGVALSSCTIPAVGEPTFALDEDQMEIGMGIHGEQGIDRGKLKTADEIVNVMLPKVLEDLPFKANDEVSVLINGLGATAPSELFILYRKVHDILEHVGIKVYKPFIGEYATSMEMKGASISLIRLDSELKALLDAPCHSPFLLQQLQQE
jgi:dihydroxyacetone kinase